MKKIIYLLLVMVLCIPMVAMADLEPEITKESVSGIVDGKITRTYNVYVKNNGTDSITSAEYSFSNIGSGVVSLTCKDSGDFSVTQNQNTCKWALPSGSEGQTGEKILVGVVETVVNATAEDCGFDYTYNGNTGKVNPETGNFVPVVGIGSLLLLGCGAYMVVSKKNKLSRI